MPREAKVKYDDVARACARIIGRGKNPTVDAVYEEVGRVGSRSTLNKLRNEFLEKFQAQGLSMLPSALPEALVPAVEDIWSVALMEAGKSYTEHEKAYETKLDAQAEQLSEIKETLAVQEKMLQDRQRELRLAYEEKANYQATRDRLLAQMRGQEESLDRLREDKDRLNKKLADERTEADRRFDQAAQDWATEKVTFKEALETLKEQSRESDQKQERLTDYWAVQVQDARDQVGEVKERMREEKTRYHNDLSLERTRTAQLSKHNDRLTMDLDRQNTMLADLRHTFSGLESTVATVRDQIAALANREGESLSGEDLKAELLQLADALSVVPK